MVRPMRALAGLALGCVLAVAAGPSTAAVRTLTFSWDTPADWIKEGWSQTKDFPILVRVYVGPSLCASVYDNLIPDQPTIGSCQLDLADDQRFTAVARAEQMKGPRWQANTAYVAGDIVVPTTYDATRGDVYLVALADGASGAGEPVWTNTHGSQIVDATVTWEVHNLTPQPWQAGHVYAYEDRVALPPSAGLPGWFIARCISGGTSGATQPDWGAAVANLNPRARWDNRWTPQQTTVQDGPSVVWVLSGRDAYYANDASLSSQRVLLYQGRTQGKRWN